jgi:ATP-dependent DNA helicase RecG
MSSAVTQLETWMRSKENERLEFKEAKNNFHFEKLVKYCCALANERGGKIILGVSDKMPRQVVGTSVYSDLERTKAGLTERLRIRVDVDEIAHPNGRVLVFHVPSRPIGMPIQFEGAYWMRSGEDLVGMTPDQLKRILDEAIPDFSAEVLPEATLEDLDPTAIQEFRQRWHRKSQNGSLLTLSDDQLLRDAELITPSGITRAALILLGTRQGLRRFMAQAEVIFENRLNDADIKSNERIEWTEGFLTFHDQLWQAIDKRNGKQSFQHGLFQLDILLFNEQAIREAVLNAVSHRDYRNSANIFVKQFPTSISIISPGGLPEGVTVENILTQQNPRNRRLAEALLRCGLIERAGQGMDLIYTSLIRESKPQPDFSHTDAHWVYLTLRGEIQDPNFLRFLERIGQERLKLFTTQDFLILDTISKEKRLPENLKDQASLLKEQGVIEKVGRKYILSRGFYDFIGQKGTYTRKRGLDREHNKALLLKHITDNADTGSPLHELCQVLPNLNERQVRDLVYELRDQGKVERLGVTRNSRWLPTRSRD